MGTSQRENGLGDHVVRSTQFFSDGSSYQVGVLTVVFAVVLMLKYNFFSVNMFRIALLAFGLIAAVVLCGNVRPRFTCSRTELLIASGLFSSIVIILLLIRLEDATTVGLQRQFDFLDSVVAAPVSEEAFYRLFLLNLFVGLTGRRYQGLVISSILFDLNHIAVRYAENPSLIVPAMICGIFIALLPGIVFLCSQNLGVAVAFHSVLNLAISLRDLPVLGVLSVVLLVAMCVVLPTIHYIHKNWGHIEQTVLSSKWYLEVKKDQSASGLGVVLLVFLAFGCYFFLLQFYTSSSGYVPLWDLDLGLALLVVVYLSFGAISLIADAIYRKSHRK